MKNFEERYGMKLFQALCEIFYFPFYFVSLNMAGFMSFVRFIQGSQPPMWKKAERVSQTLYPALEEEEGYKSENLDYPKASSSRLR